MNYNPEYLLIQQGPEKEQLEIPDPMRLYHKIQNLKKENKKVLF